MAITSPIDDPSEPSRLLTQLFTDAVMSLMLMSKARAIRLQSESARLKPGTSAPPPATGPEENLKKRWSLAQTNRQRLHIVRDAQKAVNQARYGGVKSERFTGTLDWKIAVARDPRPGPIVAGIYDISPSYVRTLRKRYGDSSPRT